MQACSRKIALSPEVDLSAYAAQTQGFSGADLQALVYNAHLDAIHATLSAATNGVDAEDVTTSGGSGEPEEIAYTAFGGTDEQSGKVLSRAEQASVTKRLELILASMASSRAAKSSKTLIRSPSSRPVTHVDDLHLQKSLKSTRPSVPPAELVRLRKIQPAMSASNWPPALKTYADETLAKCTNANRAAAEAELRRLVLAAMKSGELWTTDWSKVKLEAYALRSIV
ncbi:hypothetical protein RQP46_004712 [Phenoliferia psychrophenolica]